MEEQQIDASLPKPEAESKPEDLARIRQLQEQVEQLQEELRAAKVPPPATLEAPVQQYPKMLYHLFEVPRVAVNSEEEELLASLGYTPEYDVEEHKLS